MLEAFLNKPAFAVSVTPKGVLAEVNNTNVEMSVMHENVRKTLGGNGEITGTVDAKDANEATLGMMMANALQPQDEPKGAKL